jgi:hypothetical protein
MEFAFVMAFPSFEGPNKEICRNDLCTPVYFILVFSSSAPGQIKGSLILLLNKQRFADKNNF